MSCYRNSLGDSKLDAVFEAVMAEVDSGMPSGAYDPLAQVLRDNPTLTREKAEEMAQAFGF